MRDAGVLQDHEAVVARCHELLEELKLQRPSAETGTGVHLLPLFVVVGIKDD